jgi:hypothetical protein
MHHLKQKSFLKLFKTFVTYHFVNYQNLALKGKALANNAKVAFMVGWF